MKHPTVAAALAAALTSIAAPALHAAESAQLQQLRQEMDALRKDYDARMAALEARLKQAEAGLATGAPPAAIASGAAQAAAPTQPDASLPSPTPPAANAPTAANAFNPALALILSASYASLSQDPATYQFPGFLTGGEIGAGPRGFSLGESELTISGSIDPWFYGALSLALTADDEAEVEEAFIQTTALPQGLTLCAGRFLSGVGYLNEKHAHTWDFIDAPLAYQAFLGGALRQDGLQLRALLPTAQFIELGAELGAMGEFPSGGESRSQPGTAALFVHTGGDIGASWSWRAGASLLWAESDARESDGLDAAGNTVTNVFAGNSRYAILDAVWKWAPNGNPQRNNLTLQGEYFWRRESGSLTYDSANLAQADSYRSSQSGWYAQAVYQFVPSWRAGLRYDRLAIGNVDAASNTANLYLPPHSPSRTTLMLDWAPSEFSRVRLQWANDRVRYGLVDNQFLIQYQMSLGAHGAHGF